MALSASRYSKFYLNLARSDMTHSFPRYNFIREPNIPNAEQRNVINVRRYTFIYSKG